ncbi:hypothetical protein SDC9_121043 [bioreactor metagenome]|uniref:Uncharacterized protein n=1 Tax=bioreactor metagenome TaxID=1076179 RepID=A0A645CAY2_9ZZZZ
MDGISACQLIQTADSLTGVGSVSSGDVGEDQAGALAGMCNFFKLPDYCFSSDLAQFVHTPEHLDGMLQTTDVFEERVEQAPVGEAYGKPLNTQSGQ